MPHASPIELAFQPLTLDRWPDLELLFGPRGACGGCWCMVWRMRRADFAAHKGEGNREALRAIVASGEEPGVLAYAGEAPIAWVAVAPREAYPALDRSRVLARIDDLPVWSISCIFVARRYRRHGITPRLLEAACRHAASHGATIVEGYPVESRTPDMPAPFVWTGIASSFRQAGFIEVARRSASRPIMRRVVC